MPEDNISTKGGILVSIQHYLHILLKWKWTSLFFFLAVVGGTTLFSFLVPPVYTARGSVWIEDQLNILPFADVQKFDPYNAPTTYSQLLLSRTLAAKTIESRKLYENLMFVGKPSRGKKLPDPADPVFRERLIENLIKSISLRPIGGTRLLEVSFSSHSPQFASETLNALFDEYIDLIIRQRYVASEQATQFLKSQITAVRAEIEESERKLSDYGSAKNILPLTTAETPTIARLSEVNKALTDATIERIRKFDYYNQINSGTAADVSDNSKDSPAQRLREQYTALSREYARRLATLKPEYPEMQRLKSELDSIKESLQNETNKTVGAAYSDYQTALKKEQSLKGLLDQLRNEAFKANSNTIVYNSLRVELDNKKALLEALSKRQSETDVSSRLTGLEATNVWIVDRASLPLRPTSPNKRKNVLMGFLFGLAGALGLAIGVEYLNSTVKTSRDITNSTGFPTLGVVPSFDVERRSKSPRAEFVRLVNIITGKHDSEDKGTRWKVNFNIPVTNANGPGRPSHESFPKTIEMIASREPQSIQAESYRSIRTTLLVSSPPGKIKAILMTSPLAREGKSATISNLGITLAQANKRVVIVDADLRRPKQSKIFGLNNGWGLTHFVSSFIDAADLVRPTQFPNLFLISSGPIPSSPIELLTSEKMDNLTAFLKRSFDYILFDSPPLLAVSDALAMGPLIDRVILVVRGGQTPIPALKQAQQRLEAHKLKCLGVILNGVNLVEQDGYYAKQYYQYSKPE